MAMGERNPIGPHPGPAVGQVIFAGAGRGEYRFSAAEKAWFDQRREALQQSEVHRGIIHFSYLADTKHSIYAAIRSP